MYDRKSVKLAPKKIIRKNVTKNQPLGIKILLLHIIFGRVYSQSNIAYKEKKETEAVGII